MAVCFVTVQRRDNGTFVRYVRISVFLTMFSVHFIILVFSFLSTHVASRTTHCVPNSKELVFFELHLQASSLCEMATGVDGKENVWSYKVWDSQEFN